MFDEVEAVRNVLNGDLKAFQLLVQQYEKLVYSVLNRMLTSAEDKEDLGQEVFIKVYDGLAKFQFQSKLSTWIARITFNTAVNFLKKNKRESQFSSLENLESIQVFDETPESKMQQKELHQYINELVDQLPVQYKTIITLYHFNDFSYREIQDITNLPEGTVKGYLFRARKLLKEKLENYGGK